MPHARARVCLKSSTLSWQTAAEAKQIAWPHRQWRASWIALEVEAMIKKGDYLVIKPEWRDAGDEAFTWVARSDEQSGQVDIQR